MDQKDAEKKNDNWAEMSDEHEEEEVEETKQVEKPKKKAAPKGSKNKDGDFIVTTIDIPDMRAGIKGEGDDDEDEEDSESDEGYGEEDDTAKPVTEEVKEGKLHRWGSAGTGWLVFISNEWPNRVTRCRERAHSVKSKHRCCWLWRGAFGTHSINKHS
jgi:hypothetical protein